MSAIGRLVDRHPVTFALGVAAANLAQKLPGLSHRSLWLDEAWTVALGMQGPAAIVRIAARDENPPLYNFLSAAWIHLFGTSEAALRLPSALASVACALLLLRLVRRWFGGEAALYASLLFLAAEPQLHYAREARAYAILTAACVLSFDLFLRHLERPRWPTAIGLVLVNAAALYTHYMIGLAFLAQALCALGVARSRPRAFASYVASQAMVLLLFAPFAGAMLANLPRAGASWLAAPDLAMLRDVVRELAGSRWALRAELVLLAVAAALGRGHRGPAVDRLPLAAAAAWAVVPVAVAFVVSQWSPIFHARYLLFAQLGWIALTAAVLARFNAPAWARVAIALAIAAASARGIAAAPERGPDWRRAVAIAREAAAGGAPIAVARSSECISFAYYAERDALASLFEGGAFAPRRLSRELRTRGITCLPGSRIPLAALRRPDRVVLVLSDVSRDSTTHLLRAAERAGYRLARSQRVVGAWVGVLERSAVAAGSGCRLGGPLFQPTVCWEPDLRGTPRARRVQRSV